MKISSSACTVGLMLLVDSVRGRIAGYQNLVPPPLTDERTGIQKRSSTGQGVFRQLIDHSKPCLGKFNQSFWWSDEYYAGPGSPVIFFTPGEVDAAGYTGYLTNRTLTGLIAQAVGGAVVLMEHRYWGTSSPYDQLTTKNLQYLTLENAIKDTTYFANNVEFPFDINGTSHPSKAPWIFSGGSYSGALSAWTNAKDPGTFWAYHATSAVVETIDDFWQYFAPVQAGLPSNCTKDVELVIDHVDKILFNGSAKDIHDIKNKFGLAEIEHDDDFANVLENGPWTWQEHDVAGGYSAPFQFCDYVENMWPGSNNTAPGAGGVGLQKALNGYAKWIKDTIIPGTCEGYGYWTGNTNLDCFNTYNASSPIYTDVSLSNAGGRQWEWLLCNEPFKFWQDGAPEGVPTIVSRLMTPAYWERQCGLYFPPDDGFSYGIAENKTSDEVDVFTGGWNDEDRTRLVWVNGEFDPWKDATVSSEFRPGGPLQSTPDIPVYIVPGGIHCTDLIAKNGIENAGVQHVIDEVIAAMVGWVAEFPKVEA